MSSDTSSWTSIYDSVQWLELHHSLPCNQTQDHTTLASLSGKRHTSFLSAEHSQTLTLSSHPWLLGVSLPWTVGWLSKTNQLEPGGPAAYLVESAIWRKVVSETQGPRLTGKGIRQGKVFFTPSQSVYLVKVSFQTQSDNWVIPKAWGGP